MAEPLISWYRGCMNTDNNREPKLYCDNVSVSFGPEIFGMSFFAGEDVEAYAFSPQHAKRFSKLLHYYVQKYEEQHGPILADWSPSVPSPIQRTVLPKKRGGEGK